MFSKKIQNIKKITESQRICHSGKMGTKRKSVNQIILRDIIGLQSDPHNFSLDGCQPSEIKSGPGRGKNKFA